MVKQASTVNDRLRTYWTPPMERYFIDLMLDQVEKGNRVGHTFNKQAWTDMLIIFNEKFGSKYDKDVLKGRYKNLWEQYNDVKILLQQPGFVWDETGQLVIASDQVWDSYLKKHPDIRCYKTKPVLNYKDMCIIYGYTIADGRYSRSSHDVEFEDYGTKIKEGSSSQTGNFVQPRTTWTPTMDRFFVDLMLEQVHNGSKIENSFTKQAWTEMIMQFNENFDSKYSKNVLRSRCKILRKHYNDMKALLSRSEFELDETRQMVVADDCVWDAYIKAHPEARSSRLTFLPDYNDLCMIYQNETGVGEIAHSVSDADLDTGCRTTQHGEGNNSQMAQTTTNCERSRTYWTPPMDRYFIDLILEQVHRGNKIDNTFITQAWEDMTTLFNLNFGSQYSKDVMKNRYKSLRKQYTDVSVLLKQNEFTWDETRQMVTADDNTWDAYIKAHPDARSYRIRIMPHYEDLHLIFGTVTGNGRNTNYETETVELNPGEGTSNQDQVNTDCLGTYWTPDMDQYFITEGENNCNGHDGSRLTNVEGIDSQASISDGLRTFWTPSMDHYFMDLMIEQVRKGCKVDYALNRQGWADMIRLFKEKFGSQHEKNVLRNRYKNMRKQFNDIKNLLSQSGFVWDQSRQMVMADDDAWDAYLKSHPQARSYRTKSLLDYKKLCMIYGNVSPKRKDTQSGEDTDILAESNNIGAPATSGRPRTYWTPQIVRDLMDLLLDQVHKGNRVDNAFNKEAWTQVVSSFIEKHGSQYNKDVLENGYTNLRKQYNYIKNLLSQTGFVWDEEQLMVTANENVWDSYIKEHPDALSYRNKMLANFNDLCIIYDGRNNDLCHKIDSDDHVQGTKSDGVLQSSAPPFCQGKPVKEPKARSATKKHPSTTPLFDQDSRKLQKIESENSGNVLSVAERVVISLRNQQKENASTTEHVMSQLQSLPDLDEDLILDACDLLEDETKAKIFLALDVKLRKKWLIRKLRP
ncbi:hypothetical protein MKW92_028094 [Papaver armeniacum]|nr:hypothetical protein MKW92_028094 [Papaver armeniacum]